MAEVETSQSRVVCPAAKDPAIRLFIVAGMLMGFAVWCFRDGIGLRRPTDWGLSNINDVAKYVMNVYGPYVFFPFGLALLVWALLFLRRRLVADSETIGFQGGPRIPWSAVETLDATELKSKGVLYLEHGKGERLTLDSWKLQNFRELVILIEKCIPPEKRKVH